MYHFHQPPITILQIIHELALHPSKRCVTRLDANFVELRIADRAAVPTLIDFTCEGRRRSQTFIKVVPRLFKVRRSFGVIAQHACWARARATPCELFVITAER